jgi:hypothetical protein
MLAWTSLACMGDLPVRKLVQYVNRAQARFLERDETLALPRAPPRGVAMRHGEASKVKVGQIDDAGPALASVHGSP